MLEEVFYKNSHPILLQRITPQAAPYQARRTHRTPPLGARPLKPTLLLLSTHQVWWWHCWLWWFYSLEGDLGFPPYNYTVQHVWLVTKYLWDDLSHDDLFLIFDDVFAFQQVSQGCTSNLEQPTWLRHQVSRVWRNSQRTAIGQSSEKYLGKLSRSKVVKLKSCNMSFLAFTTGGFKYGISLGEHCSLSNAWRLIIDWRHWERRQEPYSF